VASLAVITIEIDPEIGLGPLTLTWHGLMIAVGVVAAGWLGARFAREQGLDTDVLVNLVTVTVLAGIIGARVLYLIENDAGALVRPGRWIGPEGFSFYGAIILGVPAALLYLRSVSGAPRYLDAMAAGFPLGMAVGRVGDLINGEHYGPQSDLPWAFRYTHPNADVPSDAVAYHSGGFYEIVLALGMLAVLWSLRARFRAPTSLLWAVIGLYGAGRFFMFFLRSDSDELLIGLSGAQFVSLGLVVIAAAGLWTARRQAAGQRAPERDDVIAFDGKPSQADA
jgi:phosphatidylglycerol:prolipoprotein diacylglycerol transferase